MPKPLEYFHPPLWAWGCINKPLSGQWIYLLERDESCYAWAGKDQRGHLTPLHLTPLPRPVEESIKLCPMEGEVLPVQVSTSREGNFSLLSADWSATQPHQRTLVWFGFSFTGHKVVCWTRYKKTIGEKSWWTITPVIVTFADHLEVPSRTLCLATFVCFENSSFETWNTSRIRWKISGLFFSRIVICSFIAVMMLWVLSSAPCFELFSAAPEGIP